MLAGAVPSGARQILRASPCRGGIFFPRLTTTTTTKIVGLHTLNCGKALKKADESRSFGELAVEKDIGVLQGIGPVSLEALNGLGIRTINDLATYKYYHIARSVAVLSTTEEEAARADDCQMNINKAVDKKYETKTLQEIVAAPVAALQGISEEKGLLFHNLGVQTVGDLATLKYCQWAESIVELAKYEE